MKTPARIGVMLLVLLVAAPCAADLGERMVMLSGRALQKEREILEVAKRLNEVFRRYSKFLLRTFGDSEDGGEGTASDYIQNVVNGGIDLNIDAANFANTINQQAQGLALPALAQTVVKQQLPLNGSGVGGLFGNTSSIASFMPTNGSVLAKFPNLGGGSGVLTDIVLKPEVIGNLGNITQQAQSLFNLGKVLGNNQDLLNVVIKQENPELYGGIPAMAQMTDLFRDAGFVRQINAGVAQFQQLSQLRNVLPGMTNLDILQTPLQNLPIQNAEQMLKVLDLKNTAGGMLDNIMGQYGNKLTQIYSGQFNGIEAVSQITSKMIGMDIPMLTELVGLGAAGMNDPSVAMEKYRQTMVRELRLTDFGPDAQPYSTPMRPVQ